MGWMARSFVAHKLQFVYIQTYPSASIHCIAFWYFLFGSLGTLSLFPRGWWLLKKQWRLRGRRRAWLRRPGRAFPWRSPGRPPAPVDPLRPHPSRERVQQGGERDLTHSAVFIHIPNAC